MATKLLPAQDVLNQLLSYNPETGKLFWKERPVEMFSDGKRSAAHSANNWNSKNAGKEAFTTICAKGYAHGSINGVSFKKHRVVWKMLHGHDPEVIDHDNGARADNTEDNLVDGTHGDNGRNCKIRSDNTSGCVGVHWLKSRNKWQAFISVEGRTIHLGLYEDLERARAVRAEAARKYGYHPNHGRQA